MITKQDLEDYRFREISLEQQFAKLKMWKNKLTRLHTTYGSGRVAEKLGYVSDCLQLHEIVKLVGVRRSRAFSCGRSNVGSSSGAAIHNMTLAACKSMPSLPFTLGAIRVTGQIQLAFLSPLMTVQSCGRGIPFRIQVCFMLIAIALSGQRHTAAMRSSYEWYGRF